MITYLDILNNKDIKNYIESADLALKAIGYTEHSFFHVKKVSEDAAFILKTLDYNEEDIELVKIAGYLHDIGNLVNREQHSQTGAVMAFNILNELHMDSRSIALIVGAIGNHDEVQGNPINAITSALIIADKSDVRRSRVRNTDISSFDIHDRVNYSVFNRELEIDKENKKIILKLEIDTKVSSIMEYFEIFLTRMKMCKSAANQLKFEFCLIINGQILG